MTFSQIVRYLQNLSGAYQAGLLEAFKLFDKEGRGSIPMKDLQGVLMWVGGVSLLQVAHVSVFADVYVVSFSNRLTNF